MSPLAPPAPEPLPSLNALLAFEAAARHSSFTRAARELGVTQTAVSHQVRSLEQVLGTALFRRGAPGIRLTLEGEQWAAELAVVFGRLREANARLRAPREGARAVVSVSTLPSFGGRWLVPRLGRFLASHPEVDVRISATERLVDLGSELVDIGIRYGLGSYPGVVSTKLADDALIVVAAPSVARQHTAWRIQHLSRQTLLHDDFPEAWAQWFRARSLSLPTRLRHSQLTDSAMLVEAAVRGQGVALARWSLAVDELELGRLVRLFPAFPALPTGLAYYMVSPREKLRQTAVSAFRTWLQAEASVLQFPR